MLRINYSTNYLETTALNDGPQYETLKARNPELKEAENGVADINPI